MCKLVWPDLFLFTEISSMTTEAVMGFLVNYFGGLCFV